MASPEKLFDPSFQSRKSSLEIPRLRPLASIDPSETMRSGSSKGRPRMRAAFTKVKTAVQTPRPSASARVATPVNQGSLTNSRHAKRTSCHRPMATPVLVRALDPARREMVGHAPRAGLHNDGVTDLDALTLTGPPEFTMRRASSEDAPGIVAAPR